MVKVACEIVNSTDCNDSDAIVYSGAVVCPAVASRPFNVAGTYSLDPLQTGNDCGGDSQSYI